MTPSGNPFDVWTHGSDANIVVDILFPNGIIIPLEVSREAALLEIKEDAWEEAQHYPLYGVLREMQTYVFVCINQTTAEQEELVDEDRKLCDVRPFQAVLRLVERKGDKAEKLLKTQIGLLIGKGLHEFDALKNPEINDFRWQMRHFSEEAAKNRESKTWMEKVLYQYPIRVEKSAELPTALMAHLEDGWMLVSVQFETTESAFNLRVLHQTPPEEVLEMALTIKSLDTGCNNNNLSDYLLKICGRDEFLLKSYPLSQYKYIREMISNRKIPQLIIYPTGCILVDMDGDYENIEDLEHRRSRSIGGHATLGGRRTKFVSAWTIEEDFGIQINAASRLNCDDNTKLAVQAGLYHGEDLLCQTQSTETATVTDGECAWEKQMTFEIAVYDVPRMCKLCLTIYEVSATRNKYNKGRKHKAANGQDLSVNPLVWANTTVYDFKGTLKCGAITLNMWPLVEEPHANNLLNPLGSVVSNPNSENSVALTIAFTRFAKNHAVCYPSFEKVLEFAAEVETKETVHKAPHASKSYLEQLKQICEKDPLHQMHEQDKELLWFLRQDCRDNLPHSLPKLLRCLKWNEHRDVAQMMAVLQIWPRLPPEIALELLDYAYADKSVRNFAVKCLQDISDEDLTLYLLQLVQAIKYESYLQSDLVKFLLRRAFLNQHIGHQLFWLLRSEMSNPAAAIHFGLILEAYCYGAIEHIKSLSMQVEALNKLRTLSEFIRIECNRKKEGKDKLKAMMHEMLNQRYFQDSFAYLQCPLDPTQRIRRLRSEKCRFMDSKMRPLWLVFENYDCNAQDIYIMFKNGDDLRQDMLTLQMIRIMDKLWKDEGLDLRMIPYQCLATDHKIGLIEIVRNANTIANIQKEKAFTATSAFKRGSLLAWLKEHNPDDASMNRVIEEFTLSCAGYCVATYVLGIADRHNDNIMVKTNGQLFHIDFGHILGNFKEKFGIRRERVPFVLTHDLVHVITRGSTQKSAEFNRFQFFCEEAFMILRRKGSLIISLFSMMLSTGIPELTCEKDLDYLRETLVLDMPEADAKQHFRCRFLEALNSSWTTSINWFAHSLSKDNKLSD